MNTPTKIPPAHWVLPQRFGNLQIIETEGKEHKTITQWIVQLALRGSFNLIAVDEWLPDRDTLQRAVRRHTINIEETLNNPNIKRPMTCFQLLDLLMEVDIGNRPTLISNFLYHFYNADVKLDVRNRVLKQCCQQIKYLSLCNSVVALVPRLCTEEFNHFFPILAAIANETVPVAGVPSAEASQGLLF